jgi:hypothetical protein
MSTRYNDDVLACRRALHVLISVAAFLAAVYLP